MFKKFSKGSNSGMPILAVVAVMTTLAGMGVIYQVVGSIGSQTGQDHDRRELTELGSAIENKCTDLSGTSDTTSVVAISVEVQINSDATLKEEGNQLKMQYGGEDEDTYTLPDSCDINVNFGELESGNHQIEVSGDKNGNNDPEITVEEAGP